MSFEIVIYGYLCGWAIGFVLMASVRPERPEEVPPAVWIPLWGACAVALGAVWPAILLTRGGLRVWHWLGHPGSQTLMARYAKFAKSRVHPMRRCDHPSPVDLEACRWCFQCGALQEKKSDAPWLVPMRDAGYNVDGSEYRAPQNEGESRVRIHYDKDDGMPVTAGEVRALYDLDRQGRLPADGIMTPPLLAELLGCTHVDGREPCAECLGYASASDMAAEMAEGKTED